MLCLYIYIYTLQVPDYLLHVIAYLSSEQVDPRAALTSAKDALAAVQKRQKLIKLADIRVRQVGWQ